MCCSVRLPLTWRLWAGGSRGFLTPLTPQIVWWTCVARCCITSAPHTRDVTHLCLCVYVGCTCLHVRASRLRDTSSPKKGTDSWSLFHKSNDLLASVPISVCVFECLCVWCHTYRHSNTHKYDLCDKMWHDLREKMRDMTHADTGHDFSRCVTQSVTWLIQMCCMTYCVYMTLWYMWCDICTYSFQQSY